MHLKLTFAFLEEPTFFTIAKILLHGKAYHNQEIFNDTKFSSLAESTKISKQKLIGGENLLDSFHYCTFCLAQLIHVVIYLYMDC